MTEQSFETSKDFILFASKASQLITNQKVDEALNLCEAGVRKFPFYPPGHYTLGLCYEAMGKLEDAKNEFERTLVYDPAHNKAMRKLSEFYRNSGLDQLANELLIKEALYSPLNPEIIEILKEKNLYEKLKPSNGSSKEEVIEDVTTEIEIETEVHAEDSGVQSMEEINEFDSEVDAPVDDQAEAEEEQSFAEPEMPEEEVDPIDNFDPLAGETVQEDVEDEVIDEDFQENMETNETSDATEDAQEEEDFSPLMDGYFEKDDIDKADDEQWMEVENLLNGDSDLAEPDVDPVPDGPLDETEMLLEKLSHDDDDDINLEAAIADPYDQIDLTDNEDKSKVDINDLDGADLQAAVNDPYEEPEHKESDIVEEDNPEIVEPVVEGEIETISEIVSEFEDEQVPEIITQDEIEDESISESTEDEIEVVAKVAEEENIETEPTAEKQIIEETENISEAAETQNIQTDKKAASSKPDVDAEEEVTINDMLANPNLVTPTFGEILIAQHKFSEARHVFVELSKKEPDNTKIMKKIQFLDKFLQAEGPA